VYLVGPGAGAPDADPAQMSLIALAVMDRFLCLGLWRDITAAMRRAQEPAGEDQLRRAVERFPGANLLLTTSLKDLQRTLGPPQASLQGLREALNPETLLPDDPENSRKLSGALRGLLDVMDSLSKKAERSPLGVIHGQLLGDTYRVRLEGEQLR
jgi:hypothetical protein